VEDNLGLSLEAKNQTPEAISAYRKAMQLDQKSIRHTEQPYLDLGTLLIKMNQPANAVTALSQAKEINLKSSQVRYQLGKAYFDLNRFADAQTETEEAIRLNPDEAPAHYLLARIYQRVGKPEMAAEQFKLTQTLTIKAETKHANAGMASAVQ
jgi:tetratricopeptide (TPR) repeat protein